MDTDQILDSVELMAGVDRDGARFGLGREPAPAVTSSDRTDLLKPGRVGAR